MVEKELTEIVKKERTRSTVKKENTRGYIQGCIQTSITTTLMFIYTFFNTFSKMDEVVSQRIQELKPYDVNENGRTDLISPDGKIYVQTKEGSFILYDNLVKKEIESTKTDFQVKTDSTKIIYNSLKNKEEN